MKNITLWCLHNYRYIWWSVFLLSAVPSLQLLVSYYANHLGSNPLQALQHTTGRWGLIFLLISLTITPLRRILSAWCIYRHTRLGKRLEDWNWIVRLRRMLGLYCFYYASLHCLLYLLFDLALEWQWAIEDIQEKPYIILGALSYLMLIPLAITSNSKLFKRMGIKRWQRLHKTVYLILVLVLFHFWWQTKVGIYTPWPYTLAAIILLGYRLVAWSGVIYKYPKDNGMEVPERK